MASRQSPLRALFAELGARFESHDGYESAQHFGDEAREVRAVRSSVSFADVGRQDRLELTGRDRVRWLHGQVTNDIKALANGAGCRAVHLTPKGKMFADLTVRCEPERLVLTVEGGHGAALAARFAKFIVMDDAAVEEISDREGVLLIAGPEAPAALARLTGDESWDLAAYHHRGARIAGFAVTIVASAWTGERGYEICCAADAAENVARALLAAGIAPCGELAFDTLRIEAGWGRFGRDFGDEHLPVEAGLEHAISYTKGCYVGQEIIARLRTYGQPAKLLSGLASDQLTPAGAVVADDHGIDVGVVSSSVHSPTLERPIALAVLRREAAKSGGPLTARFGGRSFPLSATLLPFVARRFEPARPS
jgi:folate-binding protein YgfZ